MPRSFDLYLQDVLQAGEDIETFTAGKTLTDYEADRMLRAAVERLFEIIGEALNQSRIYHPHLAPVTEAEQQIIDFRNRIIHGYFGVNDAIVWSVVKVYLPRLLEEVRTLISTRGGQS